MSTWQLAMVAHLFHQGHKWRIDMTLSMKTLAPKETIYLKSRIKHETDQMMNQAQSEHWHRMWAKKGGAFKNLTAKQ